MNFRQLQNISQSIFNRNGNESKNSEQDQQYLSLSQFFQKDQDKQDFTDLHTRTILYQFSIEKTQCFMNGIKFNDHSINQVGRDKRFCTRVIRLIRSKNLQEMQRGYLRINILRTMSRTYQVRMIRGDRIKKIFQIQVEEWQKIHKKVKKDGQFKYSLVQKL